MTYENKVHHADDDNAPTRARCARGNGEMCERDHFI